MNIKTLRIATRQSPLALWQANHVRDLLLAQWPMLKIELVPMTTSGDKFLKDKLLAVGGKGLFVKELEEALLDKRADIAVHSSKDMPAEFPKGLSLVAICKRDNPYDVLVSQQYSSLQNLPPTPLWEQEALDGNHNYWRIALIYASKLYEEISILVSLN